MATPTLSRFFGEIDAILQAKDGEKLSQYLILEPPLPDLYQQIVIELKQTYASEKDSSLEATCQKALPSIAGGEDVGSWYPFIAFMVQYLRFLKDVDPEQLVDTHEMLKSVLSQCILALSDNTWGIVILPTVISLSQTLTRLAVGLDKRPELIQHLAKREPGFGSDEAGEKVTLVENSANTIRQAFNKCLSERSGNASGVSVDGKPEGRRIGRFPSTTLLQREEAKGLPEKFLPLCRAISKGDLFTFRSLLAPGSPSALWFLQKRILLQLQNRCEVLLWRSLIRKIFLLNGNQGDDNASPTVDFQDILVLLTYFETMWWEMPAHDGDNEDYEDEDEDDGFVDPDLAGMVEDDGPEMPTMMEVESIISSLLAQGFLHGFIAKGLSKFAIRGAKNGPAQQVGFPNVWLTVSSRADDEVPGWVKDRKSNGSSNGNVGGGMVINLSGARPVGVGSG
ncbi:MAG: hypothetical protein M1834_009579 [Cirrosporium novae-zelandiae]|nr:MAG: hypothetical protein M1834_009579 [Cirrosporium novae-zelandiae]